MFEVAGKFQAAFFHITVKQGFEAGLIDRDLTTMQDAQLLRVIIYTDYMLPLSAKQTPVTSPT